MKIILPETLTPLPEKQPVIKPIDIGNLVLLDSFEFCTYFNISLRTAFEYRRAGLVPHIRFKGRVYYRFNDVMTAMNNLRSRNKSKTNKTKK